MLTRKTILTAFLLAMIMAFHFVNNFIWLGLDTTPGGVDTVWHLIEAIKFQISYRGILNSHSAFFDQWVQIYNLFKTWPTPGNCWPPLIYLLSSLINPDHFSLFSVRFFINFIFLVLLIFSTYFLGKRFFGRKTGIFAAFLVSFYPSIYAYSHQFELDFPLTGLTALCFMLLAYSNNYSNRSYTLLLGFCLGIATLVRLQVVYYLAGPVIYAFFVIFKSREKGKMEAFLFFLIGSYITFRLFSIYWIDKIKSIYGYFISIGLGLYPAFADKKHPLLALDLIGIPIFSLKGLTFYGWQLLNLISLPLFIVFLFAVEKFIKSKENGKGFLLVCLFSPYLILTFLSSKFARYVLPVLPVIAIITAWAVVNIKYKHLRKAVILLMICYSVTLFFRVSWAGSYAGFNNILNYAPLEPPYATKPLPDNRCLRQLREEGIVKKIQNQLDASDFTMLKFTCGTHGYILQLYLLFQDYVFSRKLNIKVAAASDLGDSDYVFFGQRKLLPGDDLLKQFKIVSVFDDGAYFLERRKSALLLF